MTVVAAVAVVLGVEAWQDTASWWLVAAFVSLATVSFADDLRGVAPATRFVVQGTVAMVGLYITGRGLHAAAGPLLSGIIVCWLWVTGYTNAFNFMDGINGLAGVQAAVTSVATLAIAVVAGVPKDDATIVVAAAIGAAALGFLPHNFPRARVFMGDVGSAPLGFLLSLLAVWIAAKTSAWILPWIALLHANFVLDTIITLSRRALRREKVWQAHREHFYQRLVRAGQSHTRVTLTEGGLQIVVAAIVIGGTNANAGVRIGVGAVVVAIWVAYFAYAERTFRRYQASCTLNTAPVGR